MSPKKSVQRHIPKWKHNRQNRFEAFHETPIPHSQRSCKKTRHPHFRMNPQDETSVLTWCMVLSTRLSFQNRCQHELEKLILLETIHRDALVVIRFI